MKKAISKKQVILTFAVPVVALFLPYLVNGYTEQHKIEKAYQHIEWANDDAKELKIYDTTGKEIGVYKK